jgi:hypothetical protein
MSMLGRILRFAGLSLGLALSAVWSAFLAFELFRAIEFLI